MAAAGGVREAVAVQPASFAKSVFPSVGRRQGWTGGDSGQKQRIAHSVAAGGSDRGCGGGIGSFPGGRRVDGDPEVYAAVVG
ncbi:hypothetical protein D3C76_1473360 [compost metagenome]